jgi:intraflagellar transport protein 52
VAETAGKQIELGISNSEKNENAAQSLTFVYPFGATLNVSKPAVPVLSSGSVCFPLKRPLCALYGCTVSANTHGAAAAAAAFKKPATGKICVLGSAHVFHDSYIDKEENRRLLESLVKYLTDDSVSLNQIDADDPDINELNYIQNINKV